MTSHDLQISMHQHNPDQLSDDCIICLGSITNKTVVNGCFHYFCYTCIKTWVENKAVCPLCLRDVDSIWTNIESNTNFEAVQLDKLLENCHLHSTSDSHGQSVYSNEYEEEDEVQFANTTGSQNSFGEYELVEPEGLGSEYSYENGMEHIEEQLDSNPGSQYSYGGYELVESEDSDYLWPSEYSNDECTEDYGEQLESSNGSQYSYEEPGQSEESDYSKQSDYSGDESYHEASEEQSESIYSSLHFLQDSESESEFEELIEYSTQESSSSDEVYETDEQDSENTSDYSASELDYDSDDDDDSFGLSDLLKYFDSTDSSSSDYEEE